jgi:hypothetical protein
VGTPIAAFGYPESSFIGRSGDELTIGLSPSTTTGEVTAVFPEGRDRSMLPFPCYQVNARFDGGMSGGPSLKTQPEGFAE